MDEIRRPLQYDRSLLEPMQELLESVQVMPWYEMTVRDHLHIKTVQGKCQIVHLDDGWRVELAHYRQGPMTIKKVATVRPPNGYEWMDIPKKERHNRLNTILTALGFSKENDSLETGMPERYGIQIAQDQVDMPWIPQLQDAGIIDG